MYKTFVRKYIDCQLLQNARTNWNFYFKNRGYLYLIIMKMVDYPIGFLKLYMDLLFGGIFTNFIIGHNTQNVKHFVHFSSFHSMIKEYKELKICLKRIAERNSRRAIANERKLLFWKTCNETRFSMGKICPPSKFRMKFIRSQWRLLKLIVRIRMRFSFANNSCSQTNAFCVFYSIWESAYY